MKNAALLVVLFAVVVVASASLSPPIPSDCAGSDVQYLIDLTQPQTPFPHFWEECAGSGHALLGLRSDWQAQLNQAHEALGFKSVRFHGIFDDDMSTLLEFDNSNPDAGATYSFFNIDSVYDFLVSIGMKPLVELSFMPALIASGNQTIFHYKGNITPPSNYAYWSDLITAFVSHLIDRYGLEEVLQWHFEIWNEPNCGFWTGDQADYFNLMKVTFEAIKSVNPQLSAGGPATCQSQWLSDAMEFAAANNFTLDFISTHEYPTDVSVTTRNTLQQVLNNSRSIVGPDTNLFYTEYNDGLYYPGFHDQPFAAAFVIKNVKDVQGLVQLFSFWTFSDIFEEQGFFSTPFHEGFGMMTIHGIPKPSWRAFELLHQAGDLLIPDTLLTTLPPGVNYTTIDILATNTSSNQVYSDTFQLLITNHDVPPNNVTTQSVCVIIQFPETVTDVSATLQRIDDNNANPYNCWVDMGSPGYLNTTQIDQLYECSVMPSSSIQFQPSQYSSTSYSTILSVPPEGVAAITITV
eukprot:TRINITY_DN985_c0_g1_i1.p1 TRINITY_DN985_c0_g1~~TRINITY_DN985_c0_g1_i1.p1  ORF type:complete len:535 (-),score=134.85 TRINITY_DN985_c0_g1_i1:74-1633(-)